MAALSGKLWIHPWLCRNCWSVLIVQEVSVLYWYYNNINYSKIIPIGNVPVLNENTAQHNYRKTTYPACFALIFNCLFCLLFCMFHIICCIHHVLLYVVDHFTLKTEFWRKITLWECMDLCLMNLKVRLYNTKNHFHRPMVHILGMAFVLLWHVEEKGNEKQGLPVLTTQGMLMSRWISALCRNRNWAPAHIPCVGGMI